MNMLRPLKFGTALLIAIMFSFSHPLFAQAIPEEEFQIKSEAELRDILESAKHFYALEQGSNIINSFDRCGSHANEAQELLTSMDTLRDNSKGNVTREVQIEFENLRGQNEVALFNYKSCFSRNLTGMAEMVELNITTYEDHKADFALRSQEYKNVPDMSSYIAAVEKAISNSKKGIAEIVSTSNNVKVLYDDETEWQNVSVGYQLNYNDIVTTGVNSRAHIKFYNPQIVEAGEAPYVYVGPNTQIKIINLTTERSLYDRGIDLVYGRVRAAISKLEAISRALFVHNIGRGSAGGIRGTEASFSYDPNADVFEMDLDHGDGFIIHNGQGIQLEPRTSRTIAFGNLSPPRPLSQQRWATLVANTDRQIDDVTPITLSEGSNPTIIKPNTPVPNPVQSMDVVFASLDRKYANELVSQMLGSMSRYDEQTFTRLAIGSMRGTYDKDIKLKTFREFIDDKGQRPNKWTNYCSICWTDVNSNQVCQVQTSVESDNSEWNNVLLFWVEQLGNNANDRKITKARISTGEDLKAFELLNPVCGENF